MTVLSSKQILQEKETTDSNSITALTLTFKALTDVSCLIEFKNLERLDLTLNNLSSLEDLKECVNLKWLSVKQNKLRSLKGIERLTKLTHEQFSRLRITAATLSELLAAPELLESTGGLSDNGQFIREAAVVRSVSLVAESLARHIYGQQGRNIKVFEENSSLAVKPSYIQSWLQLLSTTPQVAPFLSKNNRFVLALKMELEDHTVEVTVQHEVLDGIFTFYDSTSARLHIYQVASVTSDLLLLLLLGSYLIILFSFLVITTRGLDDLISLFRRPPSRKVKTA